MGQRAAAAILAIARHEVRQVTGAFSGKGTRYALLAAVLLLALGWPAIQERGLHPEAGLYPIRIDDGAAFGPPALSDEHFRLAQPGESPLLHLHGDSFAYDRKDPAARAAAQQLRDATLQWQEVELAKERDQAAAFPVSVDLVQQARNLASPGSAANAQGQTPGGAGPGSPTSPTSPNLPASPNPTDAPAGDTSILNATKDTAQQQTRLHPADVQPPFPVRSLLLTFAYLIPLNFLAQLFAGSLLTERIRHRGLLVLSAPVGAASVLAGRTLPYLVATAIIYVASGLAIGATGIGWLAAIPIVLFVLAAALVLGTIARSPRELTFLLTGTTTMFSTFLFLPAVFTALPPLAFLSPVTVISASIEGEAVAWGSFLYATLPLSLAIVALAFVGVGMYREETLFSQAGLAAKLRAGVAKWTHSRRGLLLAGILAVPFALALELFVLALFIPLGLTAAFPAFVIGAAVLEESLKLLATASQRRRPGWRAGLWVGTGFFVGEKVALLVALAGFGALDLGDSTLRLFGVRGGILLLAGPLLLHAVAAAVAGLGIARGRRTATLAWLAAVILHIAYNLAVIAFGGNL